MFINSLCSLNRALKFFLFLSMFANFVKTDCSGSNQKKIDSPLLEMFKGSGIGVIMAVGDSAASQPLENYQNRMQARFTNPGRIQERLSFRFFTRGTLSSMGFAIPITSLQVGLTKFYNTTLPIDNPEDKSLISASLAGASSSPLVTLRDCLITNQVLNNKDPKDLLLESINNRSVNKLFRAFPALLLRESGWTLGYTTLPDIFREYRDELSIPKNAATDLSCSLFSGVLTTLATQPADVVRSALQNDIEGNLYKNSKDVLIKLYKKNGFSGIFAGLPQRASLITFSVVVLNGLKCRIENALD